MVIDGPASAEIKLRKSVVFADFRFAHFFFEENLVRQRLVRGSSMHDFVEFVYEIVWRRDGGGATLLTTHILFCFMVVVYL